MRKLPLYFFLGALAIPAALAAQEAEAPPTLRLSFYQCNLNEIGPTMDQIEALEIPIWDELVDEGMVQGYGHFIHAWASEWNVGIYTIAESIQAVLDATEEFGVRMQERHPDYEGGLNQLCPYHRDGFYLMGPSTGPDEEGGGGS